MTAAFACAIKAAIERKASLDELAALLREHRARGLTAAAALDALERLRAVNDDDRILEIMDIVTGWCTPTRRVWPS